jgi:hypothetical protein
VTTYFKIRDPSTGLFSTGGYYPRWSRTGKVWTTMSALSCHFTQLLGGVHETYVKLGAEVVEYEAVERSVTPAKLHAIRAANRKLLRDEEDRLNRELRALR